MTPYETIVSRAPAGKYFYLHPFGRHFLLALEEVAGKNGANGILKLAGLPQFMDNYPSDELKREFDIAWFAAINAGIDEMGRKFIPVRLQSLFRHCDPYHTRRLFHD